MSNQKNEKEIADNSDFSFTPPEILDGREDGTVPNPSEVAMRINLLGKLIVPPAAP